MGVHIPNSRGHTFSDPDFDRPDEVRYVISACLGICPCKCVMASGQKCVCVCVCARAHDILMGEVFCSLAQCCQPPRESCLWERRGVLAVCCSARGWFPY